MAQLFANNATTTLASPAASTDTSLTLADGSSFPSPTGGDTFLLTLASGSPESAWEIVQVTARSTNTVTVVRAQEGTTAQAWASGAKAELRLTAGTMVSLVGSGVGGGLVLLEQHTASNSASLDFTTAITSAYDKYLIEIVDLLPVTAGAPPQLQVSTDGGATYAASAYYWSQINVIIGGTAGGTNGASNVSAIELWGDSAGVGQGNSLTSTMSGTFRLSNPLGTTAYKYLRGEGLGHYNGNNSWYQFSMGGFWMVVTPINAFRILYSTGNIASGTVRVYGVAKS